MTIEAIRAQYPEYSGLSDAELASNIHTRFYPQLSRADFFQRVGVPLGPVESAPLPVQRPNPTQSPINRAPVTGPVDPGQFGAFAADIARQIPTDRPSPSVPQDQRGPAFHIEQLIGGLEPAPIPQDPRVPPSLNPAGIQPAAGGGIPAPSMPGFAPRAPGRDQAINAPQDVPSPPPMMPGQPWRDMDTAAAPSLPSDQSTAAGFPGIADAPASPALQRVAAERDRLNALLQAGESQYGGPADEIELDLLREGVRQMNETLATGANQFGLHPSARSEGPTTPPMPQDPPQDFRGFANDIAKVMDPNETPFEGEGMLSLLGRRGQQFGQGAAEMFAGIPEAIAVAQARGGMNVMDATGEAASAAAPVAEEYRSLMAEAEALRGALRGAPGNDQRWARLGEMDRRIQAIVTSLGGASPDVLTAQADTARAAQTDASGNFIPASDRPIFERGQQIREATADLIGSPDPRDQTFWANLAQGAGSMTAMIATAMASSAVGGPAAGVIAGGAQGSAVNAASLYNEAVQSGANEEDAMRAAGWGSLIGAGEIVPLGRALDMIPSRFRNAVAGRIGNALSRIAAGAGEEAAQEAAASILNNIVASGIYDPERGWMDGVGESALIGAILGGGVGAVGAAIGDAPPQVTVPPRQQGGDNAPVVSDVPPVAPSAPAAITPPPAAPRSRVDQILEEIFPPAQPVAEPAPATPDPVPPPAAIAPAQEVSPGSGETQAAPQPVNGAQVEAPAEATARPAFDPAEWQPLAGVDGGRETGRVWMENKATGEVISETNFQQRARDAAVQVQEDPAPAGIDGEVITPEDDANARREAAASVGIELGAPPAPTSAPWFAAADQETRNAIIAASKPETQREMRNGILWENLSDAARRDLADAYGRLYRDGTIENGGTIEAPAPRLAQPAITDQPQSDAAARVDEMLDNDALSLEDIRSFYSSFQDEGSQEIVREVESRLQAEKPAPQAEAAAPRALADIDQPLTFATGGEFWDSLTPEQRVSEILTRINPNARAETQQRVSNLSFDEIGPDTGAAILQHMERFRQEDVAARPPSAPAAPTADIPPARRAPRQMSVRRPLIETMKGRGLQIDPRGQAAQDLRAMGVTPQTAPGLFRTGGLSDLDNLVAAEFPEWAGLIDTDSNNRYFDLEDFKAAISAEVSGAPRLPQEALDRLANQQYRDQARETSERVDTFLSDNGITVMTPQERQSVIDSLLENGREPTEDAIDAAIEAVFIQSVEGVTEYVSQDEGGVRGAEIEVPFGEPETGRGPGTEAPREDGAADRGGAETPRQTNQPLSEATSAGDQTLIPGVRPVTDRDRMEAQMDRPLRGGQAAADIGLFDTGARAQTDMFDAPPAAAPAQEAAPERPKGAKAQRERAAVLDRLQGYFAPGNVVKGYNGHDRVIGFSRGENGSWTVTVEAVQRDGDDWTPTSDSRTRVHSTMPSERDLRAGPVYTAPTDIDQIEARREVLRETGADEASDPVLQRLEKERQDAPAAASERGPIVRLGDRLAGLMGESGFPKTNADLMKMAAEEFGGSIADGAFSPKDAYEALELAINKTVTAAAGEYSPQKDAAGARAAVAKLQEMLNGVPTQTRRDSETDTHQQFSTPPTYAYAVNWIANVRDGDRVLEPSAGNGGIASFAKNAGARVDVNELAERRLPNLEDLGFNRVTGENAEQIGNMWAGDASRRYDVVVMNPPFSASAGRTSKNTSATGAKHIEAALSLLDPGGRLVAIMGHTFQPGNQRVAPFFAKLERDGYTLQANIVVDGSKVYQKYGTSYDSRLLVIDKAPQPPGHETLTGKADSIADLIGMTEEIRNGRGKTDAPSQPDGAVQSREDGPISAELGRGDRAGEPERGSGSDDLGRAPAGEGRGRGSDRSDGSAGRAEDVRPEGSRSRGPRADDGGQRASGSGRADATDDGNRALQLKDVDEGRAGQIEESGGGMAIYRPTRVRLEGAKPHPMQLVESAAMASVTPPRPNYDPKLPARMVKDGLLSEAQLEQVIYAGAAHAEMLPANPGETPRRKGYFIGDGCVAGSTLVYDPVSNTHSTIKALAEAGNPINVLSMTPEGLMPYKAHAPFKKGISPLFRVITEGGRDITVTQGHRFLTTSGWQTLRSGVRVGSLLASAPILPVSNSERGPSIHAEGGQHWSQTPEDCYLHCSQGFHPDDGQPLSAVGIDQSSSQRQVGALAHNHVCQHEGDRALSEGCIHQHPSFARRSRNGSSPLGSRDLERTSIQGGASSSLSSERSPQEGTQSLGACGVHLAVREPGPYQPESPASCSLSREGHSSVPSSIYGGWDRVVSICFVGVEEFFDMHVPGPLNYVAEGLVNHNTGVGKTREIAGIIADNWAQGRKQHVLISKDKKLMTSARRDFDNVGMNSVAINDLGAVKADGSIPSGQEGVLFATYSTIGKSAAAGKKSRIDQIIDWLGVDFDGTIVFDEAHLAGNALAVKGKRGMTKPSATALAVVDLQRALPNARVVYASATGATEVANLAYADRLGIWGPGTPFPTVESFVTQIDKGGIAAMEVVARDLKQMGVYMARGLSFDGVEYGRVEHQLTAPQREMYDAAAKGWQTILANIHKAVEATDGGGRQRGQALSQFWSAHQRFFNQVLTSMQMPTILKSIQDDLKNGMSPVIQIVNTNEAATKKAMSKMEEGDSLDDIDITPREDLIQYLENSFPVHQYEEYEDDNGNTRTRPVQDKNGNFVLNAEAVRMRDDLIAQLGAMTLPGNPLDMIIEQFGPSNVAEVTGRSQRIVTKDGKKVTERRGQPKALAEAQEYQAGKRNVLVFSDAGGTGMDFHADKGAKNQARRSHYILQAGWRADRAVQGFGRTHRTNQVSAPIYKLAGTDLSGHKRFTSSIARRLDQLGALTKGQKDAGGSMFGAADNLENDFADVAVMALMRDIYRGEVANMTVADLAQEMGLDLVGENGFNVSKVPPVTQFLNRLLNVSIDKQNMLFDLFVTHMEAAIQHAVDSGNFTAGVEQVKHDGAVLNDTKEAFRDTATGATSEYRSVTLTRKVVPVKFEDIDGRWANMIYKVDRENGAIYAFRPASSVTLEDGRVVPTYHRHSVTDRVIVDSSDYNFRYQIVKPEDAKPLWDQAYADAPKAREETMHLVTGALLPIWDRLPSSSPKIVRLKLDDGRQLLGRVIPDVELTRTLELLGVDAPQIEMAPEGMQRAVLQNGSEILLSSGHKMVRRRVGGENRIEIISPQARAYEDVRPGGVLERMGFQIESIQYKRRAFLASGDRGMAPLKAFMQGKQISSVTTVKNQRTNQGPYVGVRDKMRESPVYGRFRAELDRLGLKNVRLQFDPFFTHQGQIETDWFGRTVITIGNTLNPRWTMGHEAIHAYRNMNLFTDAEWAVLSAEAKAKWIERYQIAERYQDLTREQQIEEAIAEGFGEIYETRNDPMNTPGPVKAALRKISDFLKAVRNWSRGMGMQSPADVIDAMMRGEFAKRQDPKGWVSQTERLMKQQRRATDAERTQGNLYIPDRTIWDSLMHSNGGIGNRIREARGAARDRLDRVRFNFQDRFLPVRRAQEIVARELGGPIPEDLDIYLAEEMYSGRAGHKLDRITREFTDPVIDLIAKNKTMSLESAGRYLYARHAAERNKRIAEINPDMPDGGSGMGTAEADLILAEVAAGPAASAYAELGKLVDKWRDWSLQERVDMGLMTPEQAQVWADTYQHYVPLKGWAETDHADAELDVTGIGRGYNVRGDESRRALGRASEAYNPLVAAITQAQEVAIRSEKNRVGQHLFRMATDIPSKGLWEVKKAQTRRVFNENTGLVEERSMSPISLMQAANEIAVKVDGQEHRIILRDKRLADSLSRVGTDNMLVGLQWLSRFSRYFSAINTMLNPVFVVKNFIRDSITANINIQSKEMGGKISRQMMLKLPFAMAGAYRGIGGKADKKWAKYYQEYSEAGGKVSFWVMETPEASAEQIRKRLRREAGGIAGRSLALITPNSDLNPILRGIERVNLAVDNAIRLSAFVAARENGYSTQQAASLSKNLTVNFNRRGKFGSLINALYTFSNAGFQGTHIMFKALRSNKVKAIAAGLAAMAYLLDQANAYLSDEDEDGQLFYDKMPGYLHEMNLMFMLGRRDQARDALTVPLPYGYNVFPMLGNLVSRVQRGQIEPAAAMGHMANAVMGAFNPISENTLIGTLSPTIMDPLVQISMNENFLGWNIHPYWESNVPNSHRDLGASNMARVLAQKVNAWTGGSYAEPGWVDVFPDDIDYIAGFLTGGVGRTMGQSADVFSSLIQGAEVQPRGVPLVRDAYRQVGRNERRSLYFQWRDDIQEAHRDAELIRGMGDPVPSDIAWRADLYDIMRDAERMRTGTARVAQDEQRSLMLLTSEYVRAWKRNTPYSSESIFD